MNKGKTLLDLRGNLPVSVYLTEVAVYDVKALDNLYIENEAIYLMDRGYVDFHRMFNLIHKKKTFFVTRAKDNMLFETTSTVCVDQTTGGLADERMVTYKDYSTNNVYRSLTNNFEYELLTISEL